jgi:NADH-quinone oxidoreductase subunit J
MDIAVLVSNIIFYAFSAVLLGSALMVIISKNPVQAALFLVMTFFAAAGLWMLLESEFLALILLLVYVGAVMTLFLFVVMMLDLSAVKQIKRHWPRYVALIVVIVALLVMMLYLVVGPEFFGFAYFPIPSAMPAHYSNVEALGSVLYTHYVFQFELAAVILLVAIVAAISLVHRAPRKRHKQNISEQINVKAKDRLRVLNMDKDKNAT